MTRPNIVLITVDAWRYDALGAAPDQHWLKRYGLDGLLHTPRLDQLAGESLYFSQALATAPHTSVSHASIMTGLFPAQHGVRSFLYERLPGDIMTLAERLKRHGYRTIALREGEDTREPGILQKLDILRGFDEVINNLDELASRTHSSPGQPIFAFLHLWDLHAPYMYSAWASRKSLLADYREKMHQLSGEWGVPELQQDELSEGRAMEFQKALALKIRDTQLRIKVLFKWYLQGVNWFDRVRIPYLVEVLKAAGLWDGSLHVMYGDHGEGVHPDGKGFQAFEHSQSLLDDVLRVPLILHGVPGMAARIVDRQVSLVDIFPTVLELAGIPVDEDLFQGAAFHGASLLVEPSTPSRDSVHFAELCLGEPQAGDSLLTQQRLYQRCIRSERYKLLGHRPPFVMKRYRLAEDMSHRIVQRVKRIFRPSKNHISRAGFQENGGSPPERFFWSDLQADPDECQPVLESQKKLVDTAALKEKLELCYESQRWGEPVRIDERDSALLIERLQDLGYIER